VRFRLTAEVWPTKFLNAKISGSDLAAGAAEEVAAALHGEAEFELRQVTAVFGNLALVRKRRLIVTENHHQERRKVPVESAPLRTS